MPRSAEQTRSRILDAAYKLFRRQGYSRVTMDNISEAAKLTKRTLYHHFKSKDQLLADVLESQHYLPLQAFRTFGDSLSGSAEAIVQAMFRDLAVWADKPRWAGSGFTRLVIELADLPGHPARLIARRHKAQLEKCFAELLARSGAERPNELARAVWLLSEGAISLILVHGDDDQIPHALCHHLRGSGDVGGMDERRMKFPFRPPPHSRRIASIAID